MKLIDAQHLLVAGELRLLDIVEPTDLTYAILSHTWGRQGPDGLWGYEDEEILFADVGVGDTRDKKSPAWDKIWHACRIALNHGLSYIWVDTCCINKESSAELNESINAMFSWYAQSDLCLAYLADLRRSPNPQPGSEPKSGSQDLEDELRCCRWVHRGWTLQELIAPRNMGFYDQDWNLIGSRADLAVVLQNITGIHIDALQGVKPCSSFTIAERMNWAANRKTKRPEDRAYSLLGIFGVSMPLLYGIGGFRAFHRLQEEIIKTTTDLTIFIWEPRSNTTQFCSMFANSPDDFEPSSQQINSMGIDGNFSITNNGLLMGSSTLRLVPEDMRGTGTPLVLLVGYTAQGDTVGLFGIYLQKIGRAVYARDGTQKLARILERRENYKLKNVPDHQFYVMLATHDIERRLDKSLRRVLYIPPDLAVANTGPECSVEIRRHVPESSWGYQNNWFLHVGYERGDVIRGVHLTMRILDQILEFAILVDWHDWFTNQIQAIVLNMADERHNVVSSLFSSTTRFESARWDDVTLQPESRTNYCPFAVGGQVYLVEAYLEQDVLKYGRIPIDAFRLKLRVQCVGSGLELLDQGNSSRYFRRYSQIL
ncbi:heterokaryon incompatibility protein-domain-containing protein [Xylariomycetidae sp. FL2044]|nr:heterokaryon incompatibility protein-domain-containing protein [Xylariomycetidae sp. FL2044]